MMQTNLHSADSSLFEDYPSPTEFGAIKISNEEFGTRVVIFLNKDKRSLLMLDQLRHAVDEAIRWARG